MITLLTMVLVFLGAWKAVELYVKHQKRVDGVARSAISSGMDVADRAAQSTLEACKNLGITMTDLMTPEKDEDSIS